MKRVIYICGLLVVCAACVKRVDNGEKVRADYARSLADSVEVINQQIDSCNQQISIMRDKVGEMLHDFTTVANPREVGSYTLPSEFAKRYPPTSTALVARIDDSGRFELIAALAGKAFDHITVQGSDCTASTEVVPNDQGLNYRTASLTTVQFSGEQADEVGALISDNELNPLTILFEQNGVVQSWKLPTDVANEIAQTYRLYSAQKELNRLERRVPMLHERINLLRLHLDQEK